MLEPSILKEICDLAKDPEKFQQLTDEDRAEYQQPLVITLRAPSTPDINCQEKRQSWINWRGAPYPADRHSEYMFKPSDINQPHPKILLSAVLNISGGIDEYMSHFNKKQRYAITGKKAVNDGYTAKAITPQTHAKEIFNIIHSNQSRQGRALAKLYANRPESYDFPAYVQYSDIHYRDVCVGVFNQDNILVAYLLGKRVGDHIQYDEIMGHDEHLNNQVMYLLHYYFLTQISLLKPVPTCLNYGPWYSGINPFSKNGGLNFWKRKYRFQPAYLIDVSSYVDNLVQEPLC